MALYNNPAFAQGLAGLVGSFIGNPDAEAKSLLAASEAKLNNQTAQFRDAIGETGMSGDLAGMMIRALQAGPDYSRYAPGIGDKAVDFLRAGFGTPGMMPPMAPQSLPRIGVPAGRGGTGAGTGGAGRTGGVDLSKVTQSELSRISRMVRDAGFEGAAAAEVEAYILDQASNGNYTSLTGAAGDLLPGIRMGDVPTGEVDQNDSWAPWDWFKGPEPVTRPGVVFPERSAAPNQDEAGVLNKAREALRLAPDQEAAIRRELERLGIDPSKL